VTRRGGSAAGVGQQEEAEGRKKEADKGDDSKTLMLSEYVVAEASRLINNGVQNEEMRKICAMTQNALRVVQIIARGRLTARRAS
jgi:hypothetical protein